ncbi:outer membrane beta-barrel protein [bacterium]|nr:outer membrane beta-barrel protein [bacterium]
MKKRITIGFLFLIMLSLSVPTAVAKEKKEKKPVPEFPFKRFYADVSLGYGGRLSTPGMTGLLNNGYDPRLVMFNFGDYMSVGKGLRVGVNLGYRFNRYIGIEINGGYIACPERIVGTYREGLVGFYIEDEDRNISSNAFWYGSFLFASSYRGWSGVQMVVMPGFKRCNPYVKFGLGILAGKIYHSAYVEGHSSYAYEYGEDPVFSASFSGKDKFCMFGFTAAAGVEYSINTLLSFFVEWQASMYFPWNINWIRNQKQTGDIDFVKRSGFSGGENVFGNSHGLTLGLRFNF